MSSPVRLWADAPLWRVRAREADWLVGGPGAVRVIDGTALPRQGTLSVGVRGNPAGPGASG